MGGRVGVWSACGTAVVALLLFLSPRLLFCLRLLSLPTSHTSSFSHSRLSPAAQHSSRRPDQASQQASKQGRSLLPCRALTLAAASANHPPLCHRRRLPARQQTPHFCTAPTTRRVIASEHPYVHCKKPLAKWPPSCPVCSLQPSRPHPCAFPVKTREQALPPVSRLPILRNNRYRCPMSLPLCAFTTLPALRPSYADLSLPLV